MTEEQKETLRFYTTNDFLLINGLLWHEKDEIIREFIRIINEDGRAVMKEAEEMGFAQRWECSEEEGRKLYEIYRRRFPALESEETYREIIARARQDIENMYACLEPLDEDLILYRNIRKKYAEEMKENEIIDCKGFSSCSLEPHTAENDMYGYSNGTLLKISVKKSTLAIRMDRYEDVGNEPDEVILPPLRMKVDRIGDEGIELTVIGGTLRLRDMIESDIEDYVRWFTTDTEWSDWDAPWEPVDSSEEEERKSWREYYESVKALPADTVRWKYEIEYDGKHIGWISSYKDLGYIDNEEGITAIGLDIPCIEFRGQGLGTRAFQLYIDYLREYGQRSFYTQTWSGNKRMMRVAEKLGFREIYREKGLREVEVGGRKYDAVTFRLDMEGLSEEIEVIKVDKGTELAEKLLDFVENFSWQEVKEHTVQLIRDWNFEDWETPFVALSGNKIVGMVTLMKTDYYPLPEIYPWVSTLFVDEGYRGHRISERLIDRANEYARELGFNRTYIPTEYSGLYERYGYRYVRDIVNYENGVDHLYVKELK